ncbi:MAG: alpha/beta hydrolase [Calditrichaceae bacterium]
MNKRLYSFLLILVGFSFIFLVGCEDDEATFPNQTNLGTAKNAGTVQTVTINSQYTGEEKSVKVYLPYDYDATAADGYPVVYFLHGFGGDENTWLSTYQLDKVADVLIADGKIQPMILVMPNAKNALGGSFYTNSVDLTSPIFPSGGFGYYEYYIMQEVIGTVEAMFNINPDKRAIEGHSMGGYGAMKLAMLYPDKFKSVASHSGPLDYNELIFNENSNFLPRIAMENIDPATGNPLPVIDLAKAAASPTTHPLTMTMFGLSSAFAPHFNTAGTYDSFMYSTYGVGSADDVNQFMVSATPVTDMGTPNDPSDDVFPGVDLPVRITTPGQMADTVTAPFMKYLANDCYAMLATGKKPTQEDLDVEGFQALNIYMDCGEQDDYDPMDDGAGFGIIYTNNTFDALMTQMGISHRYEKYTGAHSSDVYYRIEIALKEHDKVF